jgi:hypothetical protein
MLMPRSHSRAAGSQPTLFHPPQPRPQFQGFPQDIQDKTIRLLASLFLSADRLIVADAPTQEARHE